GQAAGPAPPRRPVLVERTFVEHHAVDDAGGGHAVGRGDGGDRRERQQRGRGHEQDSGTQHGQVLREAAPRSAAGGGSTRSSGNGRRTCSPGRRGALRWYPSTPSFRRAAPRWAGCAARAAAAPRTRGGPR